MKSSWWLPVGAAALLGLAAGCNKQNENRTAQQPGDRIEAAQRQSKDAFNQAEDAQKKAIDEQQQASRAQQEAADARKELDEAQAKANKERQEAEQAQQQAQQQTQQAQQQAQQAQQQALTAQQEEARRLAQEQQQHAQAQQQAAQQQQAQAQNSQTQQQSADLAQDSQAGTGGAAQSGQAASTLSASGSLVRADTHQLVLSTPENPNLVLQVGSNTSLTLDGRQVRATELPAGADVQASYQLQSGQQQGTALRIDAKSKQQQ